MACWITDGSTGFTIDGNVVRHVYDNQRGVHNVFNAIWQEGDGVSSGKHYWKIHFPTLRGGAGVGLTSKERFNKGYRCRGMIFFWNLSDGGCLLVGSFGPRPKEGDIIGILAVFEDERLKMFIDVNGRSLGLAFDVPAALFKSIFPIVSFHDYGSAICTKQMEIPNLVDRVPTTFTGIEGDWKLTNLTENGVPLDLHSTPKTKLRKTETDKYAWVVFANNSLRTELSKVGDKWQTMSDILATAKGGSDEDMKLENEMMTLVGGVKSVEIDDSGNLSIKTDKMTSTWTRYDSTPGPYVSDRFKSS